MLKNQWYAVLEAKKLKRKPTPLRRFGRDLVLWRDGDEVRCALDVCTHRGAALSRGRMVDGCLTCPYHGLRFDGSGACVHVPATPDAQSQIGRLRMFPVQVAQGLVWVFNGPADARLPALPWDDAFQEELTADGGIFVDLSDTFDVSYLRVMENLTDYHHVAHVHRRTAPVPATVTEFEARREGLHVHVRGQLGIPGERGHMVATTHIVAPCLANLHFVGLARFAAIATPIDEGTVWLFARYTQTVVQIPGLNGLLTRALGFFDYRLLQRLEDYPTWKSQRLADPGDISRYSLLDVDEGIRLYFEIHQELAA